MHGRVHRRTYTRAYITSYTWYKLTKSGVIKKPRLDKITGQR